MQEHSGIEDVVRSLEGERARLSEDLETARLEANSLALDLKRVEASLRLLTGDGAGVVRAERLEKGGLTDSEALRLVTSFLASEPLTEAALKMKLIQHAKASGLSGTGVHLVLRRVLKDRRFKEAPSGFELAEPQAESA